jgi:preprotein translocase subunit SecA
MAKPLAKVKVGDLLKAQKMNEIIERINNLEKRLAKLEGKTLKRKTLKVKTPKRKTPKVKNPKRKTLKRKSPKPLHDIDSIK